MILKAACHCQRVKFSCQSAEPVPFLRCYCSICRKLNGSGGYGINLGADFTSLDLTGETFVDVYQPGTGKHYPAAGAGQVSGRHFCRLCSSGLWNWDERWPALFHPYASIIDTKLPVPEATTHMMLHYKPQWVNHHCGVEDREYDEYPDETLRQWHHRMGYGDDGACR